MPATRCNPDRAVDPRASSGPAPAAASRERPPPGTALDPPWFPHPSPFVWLFCKNKTGEIGRVIRRKNAKYKNSAGSRVNQKKKKKKTAKKQIKRNHA